jgi:hypothetical protein
VTLVCFVVGINECRVMYPAYEVRVPTAYHDVPQRRCQNQVKIIGIRLFD